MAAAAAVPQSTLVNPNLPNNGSDAPNYPYPTHRFRRVITGAGLLCDRLTDNSPTADFIAVLRFIDEALDRRFHDTRNGAARLRIAKAIVAFNTDRQKRSYYDALAPGSGEHSSQTMTVASWNSIPYSGANAEAGKVGMACSRMQGQGQNRWHAILVYRKGGMVRIVDPNFYEAGGAGHSPPSIQASPNEMASTGRPRSVRVTHIRGAGVLRSMIWPGGGRNPARTDINGAGNGNGNSCVRIFFYELMYLILVLDNNGTPNLSMDINLEWGRMLRYRGRFQNNTNGNPWFGRITSDASPWLRLNF